MANNNECALSQISGYTSNSNSTNNFDLKEIEGIELNRVTYGADLSERLENINENFNKIIESDFLRGAPGRSISISTWVFNDETKGTPMGQSLIDAIMSNNAGTPESNDLRSSIEDALNNKEIKVIHDEDGNIVSSLPFTFIDTRFYDRKTLNESLANETDLSCVLVYETTTKSSRFVAAQTFPTLYWDADLEGGNFCWKINGQKTGLPCKGPQGNDGGGGTLYTVIYNADPEAESNAPNGSSAREIIGAMWLNSSDVADIKNEFIPKSDFGLKQISIKTGDTVIALPGVIGDDNNIHFAKPSNSSFGTTVTSDTSTYEYSITTAFVTDDKYYVVISGDTIHIPYVLQAGAISNLLNMIWGDHMLGLYIPSEKSDKGVTKAHTLWSNRENLSNLCIGEVVNPAEINKWSENPELVNSHSSVSLLYDEVIMGKDDDIKAVTKITTGPTTDIVEMYPESSRYQTIEVDRFEKSYLIDNMFKTTCGVIGGTYDFCSEYSGGSYFGIYQPVKIGDMWRYAARITGNAGHIFYILWDSLDDFISLLTKWYDCLYQEEGGYPPDHRVEMVVLNNLRVVDNDWVCDSYTNYNSSDIRWDVVRQYTSNLWIKRVTCDNVYIQGCNTLYFVYTFKDDDGVSYKFRSRTLTVDKDVNDRCILPIYPYETDNTEYYVPFVITGFTGSRIKVENVSTILGGENSFDVHATQNLYHQYYRPYVHGVKLLEKYDQYEGDFDQSYKVNTNDIKFVGKNKVEIETTNSHIKSSEYRVDVTGTHHIDGKTSLITTTNHYVDVDSLHSSSEDLQQYFGKSRSGTEGVWTDNDNQSICGFNGKLLNYGFKITVTDENRDDHTADVVWKYPLMDMGDGFGNTRFRSVFSFAGGFFFIDKVEYAYLMVYSDSIQKLYKFFDLMRKKIINSDGLQSIGVKIGLTSDDVKIGLSLEGKPYTIAVTTAYEIDVRMTRNYSNRFFNGSIIPYVWDLKYISTSRPVIISVSPKFDNIPYVLCRDAYDKELYNVIAIDKSTEYETWSLDEITRQVPGLLGVGEPNAIYYGHDIAFETYAVPLSKIYESDGSSDCLRADKIHRFCNEYNINGINLIDKIVELEDRIKTLENSN